LQGSSRVFFKATEQFDGTPPSSLSSTGAVHTSSSTERCRGGFQATEQVSTQMGPRMHMSPMHPTRPCTSSMSPRVMSESCQRHIPLEPLFSTTPQRVSIWQLKSTLGEAA